MRTFDTCFISYTIKAILTNMTPLSIGSGRGALIGGIENPIVRLWDKPIIPGSSIKGVLRTEAERYAKSRGWLVCDVVADPTFELKRREKSPYESCVVCRVFGGPTVASHVILFNAIATHFRVEIRTRVSICRLTGGQYPGRLFDIEYVAPGSKFDWSMMIEGYDIVNETTDEVELINYLVKKFIRQGLWIGSGRSYGHGLVKMEIEEVKREEIRDGELKIEDYTDKYLKVLGME